MVFEDSMYCLPLPDCLEKEHSKKAKPSDVEHPLLSQQMMLPSLMDDALCMQFVHDLWAHQSESMALKNWAHWHGKGFQLDFKALLPKTSCL
eukprot:3690765-Rhodomonas_salina.1